MAKLSYTPLRAFKSMTSSASLYDKNRFNARKKILAWVSGNFKEVRNTIKLWEISERLMSGEKI